MFYRLLTAFCLLCMIQSQALAFAARGHIAACELAWQLMNSDTQRWIQATLQDSPYKRFNQACTWADNIRTEKAFAPTGRWHYINLKAGATRVTADDCPANGCVLSAIALMEQRLQQNPHDWQALLFLSHFITDLHQPLHVSYAEDRGGNRAAIRFNGERTNLHRLWDGDLLGMFAIRQLVLDWRANPLPQQLTQGTTADWATESLTLTQRIYQHYRRTQTVGDEYKTEFAPELKRRLQLAATRLAAVLDKIHEQRTKPLTSD